MQTAVDKFVRTLTDDEIVQVLEDYESMRKSGVTGDSSTLRQKTQELAFVLGHGKYEENPILWMDQLASACARNFAFRYMEQMRV